MRFSVGERADFGPAANDEEEVYQPEIIDFTGGCG
jgi:hypothetical protein